MGCIAGLAACMHGLVGYVCVFVCVCIFTITMTAITVYTYRPSQGRNLDVLGLCHERAIGCARPPLPVMAACLWSSNLNQFSSHSHLSFTHSQDVNSREQQATALFRATENRRNHSGCVAFKLSPSLPPPKLVRHIFLLPAVQFGNTNTLAAGTGRV